jgi:hypothetical protein
MVLAMAIKARLRGDSLDLHTLAQLFCEGDPHVAIDNEGYYLTSARLDGMLAEVTKLHEVASTLLRQVNGAARAVDSSFRPVRLTMGLLTAHGETRSGGFATLTVAGGKQAVPSGPKYVRLAQKYPDVAEVLHILGKDSPSLDFADLYKIVEIVRDHGSKPGEGKMSALVNKGWISQEDNAAFFPAANRSDVSGDQARHARPRGQPPSRRMTLSEAQRVIVQLVVRWLDSLDPP